MNKPTVTAKIAKTAEKTFSQRFLRALRFHVVLVATSMLGLAADLRAGEG